jgi:hypothetical protein
MRQTNSFVMIMQWARVFQSSRDQAMRPKRVEITTVSEAVNSGCRRKKPDATVTANAGSGFGFVVGQELCPLDARSMRRNGTPSQYFF